MRLKSVVVVCIMQGTPINRQGGSWEVDFVVREITTQTEEDMPGPSQSEAGKAKDRL